MDKIVLLAPDLRKEVEAKVRECLDIAEREYGRTFKMPEIRYDIKNTDGGRALCVAWIIRLNLILLVENREHFLKTTVPHEVAHLVNYAVNKPAPGKKRLMPHGAEWKKVMHLFQVPPKRTHNYNCQSIDRARRSRHTSMATRPPRIDRLVKTLNKLTENEREILLQHLLEM